MARDNQKPTTPAPEAEAPAKDSQAPAKKKFSLSDLFRKNNTNKEFEGKVAPSRRELETRAAKRRAQKAKMSGGIKPQPVPAPEVKNEETEEQLQPV